MFLLRRTAFKAAIAQPTLPSIILPRTRTFVTVQQSKLRPLRPWASTLVQRRFASNEVKDVNERVVEDAAVAAAEGSETTLLQTEDTTSSKSAEAVAAKIEVAPEDQILAEPEAAAASSLEPTFSTARTGGMSSSTYPSIHPAPKATDSMKVENTAYVGNIFFDVSELELEDYFSRFGSIKSAKIVRDARGLSKGFGYVEFETQDQLAKALESNQRVFHGRRLLIQQHKPRTPMNTNRIGFRDTSSIPPSKTLFIGNMSFELSDKDLSDLFREIRNVIDVRIAIDRRTGQPRGFAHADFFDIESATKALEYLNGKQLYGRTLRVGYSTSAGNRARGSKAERQE